MSKSGNDNYIIDGESLSEVDFGEGPSSSTRTLWGFPSENMPKHPWIVGVAAIVAIVVLGKESDPKVQISAIVGITLLVAMSTWNWRSHGRSKKTRQSDDVGQDAGQAQGP